MVNLAQSFLVRYSTDNDCRLERKGMEWNERSAVDSVPKAKVAPHISQVFIRSINYRLNKFYNSKDSTGGDEYVIIRLSR